MGNFVSLRLFEHVVVWGRQLPGSRNLRILTAAEVAEAPALENGLEEAKDEICLLSLPEEVIEGHLLRFLDWNSLLRLRRVCKGLHGIIQGYLKLHPVLAPELEINEKGRTFADFLEMDIPTTKLFLNNSSDLGCNLYETQWNDITFFLQEQGHLVKSLRVQQVSVLICGKELKFFESLENLEEFEAGHYGLLNGIEAAVAENLKRAIHHSQNTSEYLVPTTFDTLKVLKIGRCDELVWIDNPIDAAFLLQRRKLEFLTPPMGPEFVAPHASLSTVFSLAEVFNGLKNLISSEDYQDNLKELDFLHHHDIVAGKTGETIDRIGASEFGHLLGCCEGYKIKFKNVAADWLENPAGERELNLWRESGSVLLSLVNLHPAAFELEMDNLERITLRTSRSYVGTQWRQHVRPEWPALQSLDLNVDSISPKPCSSENQYQDLFAGTEVLMEFLFESTVHTALTELRLNFEKNDGSLPTPSMEHVLTSCPNLRKLTLVKWPGKNRALTNLFSGLPNLEEVSLEYCGNVGNVTFVGEDQQNPVFLKLTNLKKLTLKGLDQMPMITDLLFSIVIRHLSLSHFIVTSDGPVEKVTSVGIKSLLGGTFAKTIEKFPFQDWSLVNISTEEWKLLERNFRSYNMQ